VPLPHLFAQAVHLPPSCPSSDENADRVALSPERDGLGVAAASQAARYGLHVGRRPQRIKARLLSATSQRASVWTAQPLGNLWDARLMLRLDRGLGPVIGCRCFNALQIWGQGRALHVCFLRAFGIDRRRVRWIFNAPRRSLK
jgi:hypothetical protein